MFSPSLKWEKIKSYLQGFCALRHNMTFNEERVAFYYELGRALAQWTDIEARLLEGTLRCIASKEELSRASIALGFVSIQGFRSKLLFTGAAVERALSDHPVTEEWGNIVERLSAESAKRNHLAHYSVQEFPSNTEGRRIALCPWTRPKDSDIGKPPPGAYCTVDLVSMRLHFLAAHATLANFLARIGAQQERFPKSDEQPGNPPEIRHIARQIHAELGHPQQSAHEKRLEESALNAAASLLPHEEGKQ